MSNVLLSITFRDGLCVRLREARPGGDVGILAQVSNAVSVYLAQERARGRVVADTDIDSLGLSLVGGGHLLFANREVGPPTTAAVRRFVAGVLTGVARNTS